VVELDRLLLVESIDIRIAAIGLGAALDHEGLDPRCGVAEGGVAILDDVVELLVGVASEEGRALERPELSSNAHRLKVVEDSLAKVREGRVAIVVAGVEAVWMPRFSEKLLGLGRVEYGRWRFPVEFEAPGK
jgi:hypothetical protein